MATEVTRYKSSPFSYQSSSSRYSSLAFLFVLGLWFPLACQRYTAFDTLRSLAAGTLLLRADFLWMVLLPPAAIAATISILSGIGFVQRLASYRVLRALAACALGAVWVASSIARAGASTAEALAYANFIPVMLCATSPGMSGGRLR